MDTEVIISKIPKDGVNLSSIPIGYILATTHRGGNLKPFLITTICENIQQEAKKVAVELIYPHTVICSQSTQFFNIRPIRKITID